jgi:hypothetical protein
MFVILGPKVEFQQAEELGMHAIGISSVSLFGV